MSGSLPWWLGALALAVVGLTYWIVLGRPLGVSGSWSRVVNRRVDAAVERMEAPLRQNPSVMHDALLAATIAQFGEQMTMRTIGASVAHPRTTTATRRIASRVPWTAHLVFLAALLGGGVLATMVKGDWNPQFDLGTIHSHIFGAGWATWVVLFLGGGLVGFGTQMAGGCTSGHGLSGCARLVPASLVATAIFFGTAVALSMLMEHIAL